jgi:hypothetical protein
MDVVACKYISFVPLSRFGQINLIHVNFVTGQPLINKWVCTCPFVFSLMAKLYVALSHVTSPAAVDTIIHSGIIIFCVLFVVVVQIDVLLRGEAEE